ncbi:hypothetical protein RHSIM_Rhsim01G0042800 [Rhododendron simsii]|uniref:Uncharacterized protein n=1 Tax=Rhododendron simsii TaxID=118357 RepID=A0A834HHG4_RHOSS|nr:hypothetical protein RHSIM_Rhsim01G0042800 [Rhododendron simsii]
MIRCGPQDHKINSINSLQSKRDVDIEIETEHGYHTVVLFFVSGLVAASDQWSARRGFGAALDRQRLPCQNSACQREFALWSGVLTGELFEFLFRGLAAD